jgi:hypothetical protein
MMLVTAEVTSMLAPVVPRVCRIMNLLQMLQFRSNPIKKLFQIVPMLLNLLSTVVLDHFRNSHFRLMCVVEDVFFEFFLGLVVVLGIWVVRLVMGLVMGLVMVALIMVALVMLPV